MQQSLIAKIKVRNAFVQDYISEFRKASINSILPESAKSLTVEKEITVCFISSQKIDQIFDDEFVLSDSDDNFPMTGLKSTSKVCVSKIVTLSTQLGYRKLARLNDSQIVTLNKKLRQIFQLS